MCLALGVLRGLASALETRLFALFDAGVAGKQAGLAQGRAQLLVVGEKSAGAAVGDSVGPGADATTGHLGVDIEVAEQLGGVERKA